MCTVQFLLYYDRGVIASNGVGGEEGIQGAFQIDNTQDAYIGSIFIVGMVIFSPIFATLAKTYDPFALVGVGLAMWTAAVLMCASATSFGGMLAARAFVGCGEASFVSLAAPFLDARAPPGRRAAWLALFYAFMPVGVALGFAVGGGVGLALGWRAAFVTEAVAMVPLCFLGTFVGRAVRADDAAKARAKLDAALDAEQHWSAGDYGGDPASDDDHAASFRSLDGVDAGAPGAVRRRGGPAPGPVGPAPGPPASVPKTTFLDDLRTLATSGNFVMALFAYTFYSMTPGVLAWWGPRAGKAIYDISMGFANTAFGAVTVAAGLVGTWLGGAALDAATARYGTPGERSRAASAEGGAVAGMPPSGLGEEATADVPADEQAGPFGGVPSAFGICGLTSLLCAAIIVPGFMLLPDVWTFLMAMFVGQVFLFAAQAPVIAGLMWSVPSNTRNLAIGGTMVVIHVGGDVPSPIVVGMLLDAVGSYRVGMAAGCLSLVPASLLWMATSARAARSAGVSPRRWLSALAASVRSPRRPLAPGELGVGAADETSPLLPD